MSGLDAQQLGGDRVGQLGLHGVLHGLQLDAVCIAQRGVERAAAVEFGGQTGETALRLGVTAVSRVDRVRLVDGVPLAHESARLAGEYPGLAAELERRGSLYATLRDAYGIELQAVEDTVQTQLADPVTAELLGIETGHPLLLVHRLGETAGGRPVEWTRSAYRGDRFRFVARTATARR